MTDTLQRILTAEASTRTAALLRIGLVLLLWTRFANGLAPWVLLTPERLLLATSFYLSTTMLIVGWHTRFAAAWTAATMVGVVWGFGIGLGVEEWRHHHTTLLAQASVLVACTPCGASLSMDRWRVVRRARLHGTAVPPERGPTWGLTLICLQVAAVYLYSAWDKTVWAFLDGSRLEAIFVHLFLGFRPSFAGWKPLMVALAWSTLFLEVLLPIGLFFKNWHRWLMPLGIALHLVFYVVLPVRTFSMTMILLYLAFLDPDEVHRFIDSLLEPRRATSG